MIAKEISKRHKLIEWENRMGMVRREGLEKEELKVNKPKKVSDKSTNREKIIKTIWRHWKRQNDWESCFASNRWKLWFMKRRIRLMIRPPFTLKAFAIKPSSTPSQRTSKIIANEVNQNSFGNFYEDSFPWEMCEKTEGKSKTENAWNRLFLRPFYPSNNLIFGNLYKLFPPVPLNGL